MIQVRIAIETTNTTHNEMSKHAHLPYKYKLVMTEDVRSAAFINVTLGANLVELLLLFGILCIPKGTCYDFEFIPRELLMSVRLRRNQFDNFLQTKVV